MACRERTLLYDMKENGTVCVQLPARIATGKNIEFFLEKVKGRNHFGFLDVDERKLRRFEFVN
jgi:hypothetical protein